MTFRQAQVIDRIYALTAEPNRVIAYFGHGGKPHRWSLHFMSGANFTNLKTRDIELILDGAEATINANRKETDA